MSVSWSRRKKETLCIFRSYRSRKDHQFPREADIIFAREADIIFAQEIDTHP
jgi:hypothetical protein